MSLTPHHAKYFAHDLTRRASGGLDRLSMSLFDAAVDPNPHQIEAALFALRSPLSKGVILADEVGLGKTIEAGIVLCQLWAERRRRLLVICPASIRKQWELELEEKFNLPAVVVDAKGYREARREGRDPLQPGAVLVLSLHYANILREDLKSIAWDLVVIDEAHKLRNAYRPSNKVGQGIRNLGPTDPKIQFHETLKEVEARLGDPDVRLQSYIVSNTPSATMRLLWNMEKTEMQKRHVLFQEDRDSHVGVMLNS